MGCCASKGPEFPPKLNVGACNSQGKRKYNEDRFAMLYPLPSAPEVAYFGIFDGHSGKVCATYCQDQMHKYISEYALPDLEPQGVAEAFMRCDDDFLSLAVPREMRDGSTATVITVSNDRLMVANVGDSRCVVSRAGIAVEMSIDHKASEPGESRRLADLGAKVRGKYIRSRSSTSMIAVSRAIGDKDYKTEANPLDRLLISVPHVAYMPLDNDVQFFVVASDGMWDVIDNQSCVDFVLAELRDGLSAPQIARKLVIKALNRRSSDNITVIVVVFPEADFDFKNIRRVPAKAELESSGGSVLSGCDESSDQETSSLTDSAIDVRTQSSGSSDSD
eukprot:a8774_6.p1 GENE.a8774_6~~a8774_6.p1  ORF type:complete len:369 (-),score=106.16 a8774_6:77-1078(-)